MMIKKFQAQFHTPSFGDEEFDIPGAHMIHHHPAHPHASHPPPHHQLDQYQMHSQMGLMSEQQAAYSQHQWHPQSESHPMMTNQTYHNLHSPTNHSTYHHLSSPNQMLMMQPPSHQQAPSAAPPSGGANNQHQPQMSPQMSGNNYIGQSPPQTAPINSNENGSTSDDSDDTLHDPNVSFFNCFLCV